jgi:hypothetical protein
MITMPSSGISGYEKASDEIKYSAVLFLLLPSDEVFCILAVHMNCPNRGSKTVSIDARGQRRRINRGFNDTSKISNTSGGESGLYMI